MECVALLIRDGEFHDGGATHFHTSDRSYRYIKAPLGSWTADTEQTGVAQVHDKAQALLSFPTRGSVPTAVGTPPLVEERRLCTVFPLNREHLLAERVPVGRNAVETDDPGG